MEILVRYVVISPIRDEEKYIEQTVKSMIAQSIRPLQWIIVDDGSTDQTGPIVDSYARIHPWIVVHHRVNRGFRKSGSGVVNAFYEGLSRLGYKDWEYIVKLDGDLEFGPDYFRLCFAEFRKDPRLGVGGGEVITNHNGKTIREGNPLFHVRGATKIYRRECWNDIGGLFLVTGWDTLDEVKSNMKGWSSRRFTSIILTQLKKTGSADGAWKDSVKNGLANYISGYHPFFMVLKCLKRSLYRPGMIAGVGLLYGFLYGYARRIDRVQDPELVRFLRAQQLNRFLLRKSIWH